MKENQIDNIKRMDIEYNFGRLGSRNYEISTKSTNGSIIPTKNLAHIKFENGKEIETSFVRRISYSGKEYSVVKSENDSSFIVLRNETDENGITYCPVEDIHILKNVFRENARLDLKKAEDFENEVMAKICRGIESFIPENQLVDLRKPFYRK